MEGWRHELCGALEVRRGSGCMGTIVGGAARRCREARLGEVAMKRCLRAGKDDSYYHVLAGLHGNMVARARCQLQLTGASHPTGRLGYEHRTVQRAPWPCCHLRCRRYYDRRACAAK